MKRYQLHVEVERLDTGEFYAKCPSLQGCRAIGDTLDDAIANVEDVARVLIELSIEHGWLLPPELEGDPPAVCAQTDVVVSVGA